MFLPPKFCINYCCEILLGGLHVPKSILQQLIVYAKFGGGGGGQTECIMGNWKIENSESSWMSAALPLDYEQSLCFLIVRRERSEKNRPRESWCLGGSLQYLPF